MSAQLVPQRPFSNLRAGRQLWKPTALDLTHLPLPTAGPVPRRGVPAGLLVPCKERKTWKQPRPGRGGLGEGGYLSSFRWTSFSCLFFPRTGKSKIFALRYIPSPLKIFFKLS